MAYPSIISIRLDPPFFEDYLTLALDKDNSVDFDPLLETIERLYSRCKVTSLQDVDTLQTFIIRGNHSPSLQPNHRYVNAGWLVVAGVVVLALLMYVRTKYARSPEIFIDLAIVQCAF